MSVVCHRASESDRADIKHLWHLSFEEDSEQDIDLFLNTFDVSKTAFVLCENDRVCSMLFLLPVTVEADAARYAAGYIYAGATHPSARGKGHYRHLLTFVAETAKQAGMSALVLRPATDALFDSYRRMGFTVPLSGNAHSGNGKSYAGTTTLSPRAYIQHRREVLRGCGQAFVDWDERVIAYALTWCEARLSADAELILRVPESDYVGEQLPPQCSETHIAALMKPLSDDISTELIWFGYGLE